MADQMFKGTSVEGYIQEAVSNAVDNALGSTGVADELVTWRLYEITGEKGGLHGVNTVTAKIVANFASTPSE